MSTTLSPGVYEATLQSMTCTQAKNGNPQLALKFSIGDSIDRTVYLALTDAAWPYTEKKLKTIGFNGDFDNPDWDRTKGTLDLSLRFEEYQGKQQERWEFAGSFGEATPAPQDVTRRLTARWKNSIGPTPPPASTRPGPPSAAATAAPKSAPPPAPVDPQCNTKDEAWAYWSESPNGADAAEWSAAVRKIGKGRPESAFTAQDWNLVAAERVPF